MKLTGVLLSGLLLVSIGTQTVAQDTLSTKKALAELSFAKDHFCNGISYLASSAQTSAKELINRCLSTKQSDVIALAKANPKVTTAVATVVGLLACYGLFQLTKKDNKKN